MPNFSGIWTITQQMQAKGASTWPQPPGAPTIGTATAGANNCASVTFTAPSCTGYPCGGITGYRVISTPGCITNTGASSPLVVTGLTSGTSYTFKTQATNTTGYGPLSAASNSITASLAGQQQYVTPGTYSWVAPANVTSVSIVAIGGGGSSYGAGSAAGNSYFVSTAVVKGGAGAKGICAGIGGAGGTYTGDGGGNGGASTGYGGGGAGGYSGTGGTGGSGGSYTGGAGCGGGAGGGGYGGGGGVSLYGFTYSGCGGITCSRPAAGGSGGTAAPAYNITCTSIATGGLYGGAGTGWGGSGGSGGGGGLGYKNNYSVTPGNSYTVVVGVGAVGSYSRGAGGALRIIWPGSSRQFPSTCTMDKNTTGITASQQAYTTAGTYSWVAPTGVTSVSVVAVGGGGSGSPTWYCCGQNGGAGGGGGGLSYTNNYTVTPGSSYTVVVGDKGVAYPTSTNGGDSYFVGTGTVKGGGAGTASRTGTSGVGGTYTGCGGGNGGRGYYQTGVTTTATGGGGAGGYAGSGGGWSNVNSSGGGAGAGASGTSKGGGGGGGVGLLGQGNNGAKGCGNGVGGGAGSCGSVGYTSTCKNGGNGGGYGGGSGGGYGTSGSLAGIPSVGAVRIIWPGSVRSFPSNNAGNL